MSATLYCGDALVVLRTLPDESVQCVVTSPPYWGLRDYGTATWEGGGIACDHRQDAGGTFHDSPKVEALLAVPFRGTCGKCGAIRVDAQLGIEPTPEEYVAKLVALFGEVRRVLRDDGTLWLNMGDCYASAWACGRRNVVGQGAPSNEQRQKRIPRVGRSGNKGNGGADFDGPHRWGGGNNPVPGLKEKDLVGLPWRVAFALQAAGWWLRSDIIWAKPNQMPESVTDRPTRSHEYVFLLSKSARYFYDAAPIAETATFAGQIVKLGEKSLGRSQMASFGQKRWGNAAKDTVTVAATRNARSVWEIATQPYPQAHFATFPEEMARRCILTGSRPGDTVLDPFGGSGTVAQVATGNGRDSIYIDLNPAYLELAKQRIGPMLCVGGMVSAP